MRSVATALWRNAASNAGALFEIACANFHCEFADVLVSRRGPLPPPPRAFAKTDSAFFKIAQLEFVFLELN
jgi:hypothetical protein